MYSSFAPVSLRSENHETDEMALSTDDWGKKITQDREKKKKKTWTKHEIGFYRLPSNTRQSFCKLRVKST